MHKQLERCRETPFYTPGPLTTDIAPGYASAKLERRAPSRRNAIDSPSCRGGARRSDSAMPGFAEVSFRVVDVGGMIALSKKSATGG
jgi:hypothetical protein